MSNVIKILEKKKINFIPHSYVHEEGIKNYAAEAVEKLGVTAEKIYKTLVIYSANIYYIAVLNSQKSLSLKKLAAIIGTKKVTLAEETEVTRVTGYIFGGVSPIVVGKTQPRVFIDKNSKVEETIFVSAGKRGEEIELSPESLAKITGATFEDIIQ